ncbi:somatostatin receptor type 2-like [Lingula anatina]|uniref:Somatostatin receptor type 2-like n=1 Tax=Lingula anatina TaxID=7574 RepID=A0A1S3J3T0_LINAN|nr:somatostatin receptor type 2-like [Lingula anatina]|eukprot:XP_013404921.1 somatostatin receptor type 2-like [Lingula anatina]
MITSRHAVILAFFIWATIGSANAPLLWYYKEADGDVCRLNPEHDYQYLIFIGLTFGLDFALPVLTICCITLGIAIQVHRQEVHEGSTALRRTNKRFIRLVLSILLVFVLTWGPFHLAYLLAMFRVYDNACPKNAAVFNFAVVLGLSNTCLNPVVYHLASLEFRQAFWNTLRAMRTMGQAPTDHEAGLELRPLSGIFRQNDANVTSYSCRSPTSTTCPV